MSGDVRSFEILLDRYERKIFNGAFRMVGNVDDARDITQTVFLKVHERLDQFDDRRRFFSWVYRIMINESIDCLDRKKRLAPPIDDQLVAQTPGPGETLRSRELGRAVQDALLSLAPHYRAVIVLRHLHDCSYREIGDILDLTEHTVKSRLFSGRRMLRDLMIRKGIRAS